MAGIDAVLNLDPEPGETLYDFQIGDDGDIVTEDSFEAAILVSIFTDRRAEAYEVPVPQYRRGWVGDLETPGDPWGSTLWLYEQSRLSTQVALDVTDAVDQSLAWFVDDGIAISVGTRSFVQGSDLKMEIDMTKPHARSENFLVRLWELTGKEA